MTYTVGTTIHFLRKKNNWKLSTLSEKLGVCTSIISEWEHDKKTPGKKNRLKLCTLFSVTEAQLFGAPLSSSEPPYSVHETPPPYGNTIPIVAHLSDTREHIAFNNHATDRAPISFTHCKAISIENNSLAPLAYENQCLLYSETAPLENADIVLIKLPNGKHVLKRYYRNAENTQIILHSLNPTKPSEPLTFSTDENIQCFKIVSIVL